jgi:hypothetical protein
MIAPCEADSFILKFIKDKKATLNPKVWAEPRIINAMEVSAATKRGGSVSDELLENA